IISKCFITVSVGMVRASRCHRLNMKTYIINGSEVSRLSVAIHTTPSVVEQEGHLMEMEATQAP
ncbi:hypothetical protein AAHD35_21955, partial [Enterobacter roggenkampii]|uniref:hypothetical protein n=1 Tax=Enterobacter roggenkampii TaxID=1812935 RepID=UPI0039670334